MEKFIHIQVDFRTIKIQSYVCLQMIQIHELETDML